jgi:Holliday junction resolvase RusA-like endonuclease
MIETILGNVPSKSNSYKIIKIGNRYSLGKAKALKDYEKSFIEQCQLYKDKNIEDEFEFCIDVYYDSRRPDLDNSLKIVLDCLQKVGAIKNDNKCIKITAHKLLDKENPRIEYSINLKQT